VSHETVCSDIRIFYNGIREFLTVFTMFNDPRAYNLVQKPPSNTDGQFWVLSRYSVRSAGILGVCSSDVDTFHSGGFSHDDFR